jgi:hypothetical protein
MSFKSTMEAAGKVNTPASKVKKEKKYLLNGPDVCEKTNQANIEPNDQK